MMVNKKIKQLLSVSLIAISVFLISSCNKEIDQLPDLTPEVNNGQTLEQVIRNNPDYSLYYTLIQRGGQIGLINDLSRSYTMFVPNNDAMKSFISARAGIPTFLPLTFFVQAINIGITPDQAAALVQCYIIPQSITTSSIPNTFPNFYYPSAFNPVPSLS